MVVPAKAREDGLVGIAELVVRGSLFLCCLEPFQSLIVTDSEDQIFLNYEEHLNHANSMDEILLRMQSEETVFLFSPSFKRFKDVH